MRTRGVFLLQAFPTYPSDVLESRAILLQQTVMRLIVMIRDSTAFQEKSSYKRVVFRGSAYFSTRAHGNQATDGLASMEIRDAMLKKLHTGMMHPTADVPVAKGHTAKKVAQGFTARKAPLAVVQKLLAIALILGICACSPLRLFLFRCTLKARTWLARCALTARSFFGIGLSAPAPDSTSQLKQLQDAPTTVGGELGQDFSHTVYDDVDRRNNRVRVFKLQVVGLDPKNVRIWWIYNGFHVLVDRRESRGIPARHWQKTFQFANTDGYFENDQVQIDGGILKIVFKRWDEHPRRDIHRFAEQYILDADDDDGITLATGTQVGGVGFRRPGNDGQERGGSFSPTPPDSGGATPFTPHCGRATPASTHNLGGSVTPPRPPIASLAPSGAASGSASDAGSGSASVAQRERQSGLIADQQAERRRGVGSAVPLNSTSLSSEPSEGGEDRDEVFDAEWTMESGGPHVGAAGSA